MTEINYPAWRAAAHPIRDTKRDDHATETVLMVTGADAWTWHADGTPTDPNGAKGTLAVLLADFTNVGRGGQFEPNRCARWTRTPSGTYVATLYPASDGTARMLPAASAHDLTARIQNALTAAGVPLPVVGAVSASNVPAGSWAGLAKAHGTLSGASAEPKVSKAASTPRKATSKAPAMGENDLASALWEALAAAGLVPPAPAPVSAPAVVEVPAPLTGPAADVDRLEREEARVVGEVETLTLALADVRGRLADARAAQAREQRLQSLWSSLEHAPDAVLDRLLVGLTGATEAPAETPKRRRTSKA